MAAGARGQAVAVAHGGVTVDALRTVLGDTKVMAQPPTLVDDGVACCAITVFQHTDGGWAVDLPSTAHLGG